MLNFSFIRIVRYLQTVKWVQSDHALAGRGSVIYCGTNAWQQAVCVDTK